MTPSDRAGATTELRPAAAIVLWLLLFLICAGLGYPPLYRYDPRDPRMHYDSANALYHWQVTGDPNEASYGPSLVHFRYRVLVPFVGRPFYLAARARIGSWDPGGFGLMMSTSLFSATTALLLFLLGRDIAGRSAAGIIAALLYLVSFAVPNFHLAGLVDAGEAFALTALVWCLRRGWWAALPLLGIVGTLAKETFVPFSTALAAGWLAAEWWDDRRTRSAPIAYRGVMLVLLALAGVVTLTAIFSIGNGRLVLPWELGTSGTVSNVSVGGRIVDLAWDLSLLEFFGWLLPLGAVSLRRMPSAWLAAAFSAAEVAIVLGIVNGEPGIARSLFNILGPLLSVSSSVTLTRLFEEGKSGGRAVSADA